MKNIAFAFLFIVTSLTGQNKPATSDFIVNPYLQIGSHPAPESLELLWQTSDSEVKWIVEYKVQSGTWKKIENPAFRTIRATTGSRRSYLVVLDKLVAGTVFSYRLLKNGKVVFLADAKAPKSRQQPFRFVAFGDIGAGTPEQGPIAQQVFKAQPDLVVVSGDIVYERGLIQEYDKNFWPIYNSDAGVPLMRSVPMVAAPGNHDTDTRDLDKYPDALAYYLFWSQPLNGPVGTEGGPIVPVLKGTEENRSAFLNAAGAAYPRMANFSFDYGNAHFTVIDSNPYVDFADKTIEEWVAADLATAQGATWRFVLFHHPGFNAAREHYEQQHMRLLSPVFEAGKVDLVLNGHVHNYQRSFPMTFSPDRKGTLLVGGMDNKTVRGRVVNGKWTLDKEFNGLLYNKPKGVIYLITGAGGQDLYNPEQNNDRDSWQPFTDKLVSIVHSFTVLDIDGPNLTVKQLTKDGQEVDRFTITK